MRRPGTEALSINLIFEVNYAAFSAFAALLVTEVMGSVLLLLDFEASRQRVLDYVVPIWEVTGTFGAFWVVTGDFAFPALLVPVASIFSPLLVVFLVLFVARNASISFAEFIIKKRIVDDVELYKAYAVSTLALALVVLVLISSLVGGQGVDLADGTFSLVSWATAGSIVFVIATLLLCLGLAPAFYDMAPIRRLVLPCTCAGVLLSAGSYWLMLPSLLSPWMLVPVFLTVAAASLYLWPKTRRVVANKAVFVLLLSAIVFSLQPLVYPEAIGKAVALDAVTTSGAMAGAYLETTAVGGAALAVMIGLYVRVARRGTSGPNSLD